MEDLLAVDSLLDFPDTGIVESGRLFPLFCFDDAGEELIVLLNDEPARLAFDESLPGLTD